MSDAAAETAQLAVRRGKFPVVAVDGGNYQPINFQFNPTRMISLVKSDFLAKEVYYEGSCVYRHRRINQQAGAEVGMQVFEFEGYTAVRKTPSGPFDAATGNPAGPYLLIRVANAYR